MPASDYFDKQGNKINQKEWLRLFTDHNYRYIGKTLVDEITISTIWLGIDRDYKLNTKPNIFQSVVFPCLNQDSEEFMRTYATVDEAQIGHFNLVMKWKCKIKEKQNTNEN